MSSVNEQGKVLYFPFDTKNFSSEWRELLMLLLRGKCGMYNLPFSFIERFKIFKDFLFWKQRDLSFLNTQWPVDRQLIAWKSLIKYLHGQGILSSPDIPLPMQYTDMPKVYEVYVFFKLLCIQDSERRQSSSVASSRNFNTALSKAIGEGLERYFLHCCREKKVEYLQATYEECVKKKYPVVNLHHICGFFDWQRHRYPQLGYQSKKRFRWVEGRQICSSRLPKKTYLPAQMVFWGSHEFSDEPILGYSTTNGGGAYFSREGAILSGVHELIQRDAFLIHWLRRISPARIDSSTIYDEELRYLLRELEQYKFECILLYTTLDIEVSSVSVLLIDRTGKEPVFSVGGGTGFNIKFAIRQAIYEALSIATAIRDGEDVKLPEGYEPFLTTNIRKRERIRIWRGETAEKRISFLTGGREISYQDAQKYDRKFSSQSNELQYLLELFEKKGPGYKVYTYEVNNLILRKIGYHVVKVIIPELLPLYLVEHYAPLNSERLREIPTKLRDPIREGINPWPHPFP